MTKFHAQTFLDVLDRNGVDYVLVGGYAAQLYGAKRPTEDIDITPASTPDNLERLAAALRELQAGIRVDELPEGLPFDTSAEALAGISTLNLRTPHGDIDLTFTPDGFPAGYDALIDQASERHVDGVTVHVAALTDIITSKTEAARPKDVEALPELHRLAAANRTALGTGEHDPSTDELIERMRKRTSQRHDQEQDEVSTEAELGGPSAEHGGRGIDY